MIRISPTSARLFLAVLEEGSIARAAAREHIVPSAVSRRLAELEAAFGFKLVERGRRGVRPTPAGEALAHHARMLVQSIERMSLEMTEYGQGIRGHVRVRASASSLAAGLPRHLQAFMRSHPHVRLETEELATPRVFRDIAEGRADVGVAPDIVRHDGLQVFPYDRYDLCVVVPRTHPLAKHASVRYAQTLRYEQIEPDYGTAVSMLLDGAAAQSSTPKRVWVRVSGFESVVRMVGAGMGIGIAPSFLRDTHGPMYGLSFVPLDETWAHPQVSVIVRNLDALPAAAKALVAQLRAVWKEASPTDGSES